MADQCGDLMILRHARARCPAHPRLLCRGRDVDGRNKSNKSGHDAARLDMRETTL
jgi:hypothetical protein